MTDYEIYSFKKYDNELKELILDNSEPKIYLMDLELDPQHTGMDILREIREEDWDSEIIVLTNHDRMFETVHKEIYKTFDFIEKFDNFEKRLKKDLNKILNKNYDKEKFLYNTRRISLQIYFKDIIYKSDADLLTFTETIKGDVLDNMQSGYDIQLSVGGTDVYLIGENGKTTFTGGHAMYVTGIEDNYLIVNSWGGKYKIPIEELRTIDNYDLSFSKIGGIG